MRNPLFLFISKQTWQLPGYIHNQKLSHILWKMQGIVFWKSG